MFSNEYRPALLPKVRSKRIMAAAEGKPCTLRISSFYPGYRCAGPETTVGCHPDNMGPAGGKGISTKPTDTLVMFGCAHCHDILSGVDKKRHEFVVLNYEAAVLERMIHALRETHAMLLEEGIMVIPDAEFV